MSHPSRLLLLLLFLIWNIVDLHCCFSFTGTIYYFSYTYTYINYLSHYFLIWITTEYWIELPVLLYRPSLVAQRVKCLPAMRETRVQSLGWEDSLEKEMATHSSIRSLFTIYLTYSAVCVSRSVVSDPLWPMDCSPPSSSVHGIFPGKNTEVVCHFLLWLIFPTQRSSLLFLCLLHCRQFLFLLCYRESHSVCMLIPSSQLIPVPHIPLLVTTSLFPKSVSLFQFCK